MRLLPVRHKREHPPTARPAADRRDVRAPFTVVVGVWAAGWLLGVLLIAGVVFLFVRVAGQTVGGPG